MITDFRNAVLAFLFGQLPGRMEPKLIPVRVRTRRR